MTATAPPVSDLHGLARAMLESLRGYWRGAAGYQRFLYVTGALLTASGLFHLGVFAVAGGPWEGDVSWRKPVVFGLSFGLTATFVGWVMSFLPPRRGAGWLLAGTFGVAAILEVALITMQQWRGVPSHFNDGAAFDAAVFTLMGLAVAFIMAVVFVLTLWVLLSLRAPASLAWAIRLGMVLLSVSQLFGVLIVVNGSSLFGEAGAMKLPHALSLHGIQVLPVTAWLLLFTGWSEARRLSVVLAAGVGYGGLVAATAYQTFSGLAPLDLATPAAVGHGVSAALFAIAGVAVLIGLGRRLMAAGPEAPAGTGG